MIIPTDYNLSKYFVQSDDLFGFKKGTNCLE